jgi:hypothetical protein
MQITELLKLTNWFNINIVKTGIPQKYTDLYNRMNQNLRRNQNVQIVPFEAEKENLYTAIKPINFQALSLEQIRFLDKLEITNLLGVKGVSFIEETLIKNNLDLATATANIKTSVDKLNLAVTTINELETPLKKSFSISQTEDGIEDGSVLMRIYFQNDVGINNLVDLKKLSETWYDIGRGIAMAQGKSPEDFRVVGAEKGSIIIDLAVIVGIATTVSKILLEALKVADRVLDIMKKVEEIKALKLANNKIEKELQKEAENEKEQGIKSILSSTIEELGLNLEAQGDKINAIEKSIKKLIDFTQSGGVVDFVQPKESASTDKGIRDENNKLVSNIKEIRKLESKTKVLEK